jgi:type II secretory pathway pseudopilin PulG
VTGRDRIVIVVVAVAVAIGAAWIEVISPKRDEASKLAGQVKTAQSTLDQARATLAAGQAARQAFHDSYATLVRLGEAVPTDDNVPSLIYQVQSAASKAGVDFRALTLNPAGASGVPTPATSSTPSSSTSTSTSTTPASAAPAPTTTPSTTTPPSTATAASSTATGLPPGVVAGPAGFPVEPFTLVFQGNFFHLADFFGRLQRFVVATDKKLAVSGRLLNLDAIDLAPAPSGFPQILATVSATSYLLPSSQGLLDGATPAGPATTSQQASTTTPSSSSAPAPAPAVVTPGGGG